MNSNYIVRNAKGELFSFYYSNSCIYMRQHTNGKWSRAQSYICDVRESYSVSVEDDSIYILCQENTGNILLCRIKDQNSSKKIILENSGSFCPDIHISSIIIDNRLQLIYNSPDTQKRQQIIKSQCRTPDGEWEKPIIIDTVTPNGSSLFKVVKTGGSHFLTYINTNTLYCREISNSTISDAEKIFTGNIIDYSLVWSRGRLHFVLGVKTRLGIQLIYIRDNKSIVLWEGNSIKLCSINVLKNQLNIYWVSGNRLFFAQGYGDSFNSVDIKNGGSDNYVKAGYISATKSDDDELVELIVNGNRPYDIYFNEETDFYKPKNTENVEQINRLKAQISNMNDELSQKDSTINQLYGFKIKNQELQKENSLLRQRYKELLDKYKNIEKQENNKQLPVVVNETTEQA